MKMHHYIGEGDGVAELYIVHAETVHEAAVKLSEYLNQEGFSIPEGNVGSPETLYCEMTGWWFSLEKDPVIVN